jgi:hypothetical protein
MPFYEYEFIVQNLIDILKEKQEAEEGQQKKYDNMSPGQMMKEAGKSLPGGVNPSSFKAPKMPSFPSIPSSLKL